MRNIALVPQRDVFVRGQHVAAHHAGEAADLLAGHGIAFVRHGRTAALLAAKMLFRFAHFGALQMANFQRNFFKQRGNQRQRT